MNDPMSVGFEAKMMEPIYRMVKIVAQEDPEKAQTLMAVTIQYMTDYWMGKEVQPSDVQKLLRAVLLHYEEGRFYAAYVYNELQVKIAGWLTLMAIDRPVTLGDLGRIADEVADQLAQQNCLTLTSAEVMAMVKGQIAVIDDVVYQRMILNEAHLLTELQSILIQ